MGRFALSVKRDPDGEAEPNHVFGTEGANSTVVIAVRVRGNPGSTDICTKAIRQAVGGQVEIDDGKGKSNFAFDFVFPENCNNFDIWATVVRPCVDKILKGINSAVFAYGGTGSGKSYTMGFEDGGPDGQLQYAANYLFKRIHEADVPMSVYCNYFEIYGNAPANGSDNAWVTDLLSESKKTVLAFNQIRIFNQITHVKITDPKHLMIIFNVANAKRQVGSQDFNSRSSRSHGICQIMVAPDNFISTPISGTSDLRGFPKQPIPWAKMSVIDLAGSEPANLWYNKDDPALMARYNEAVVINQGLSALKNCMASMAGKKGSVTNANASMLTRVLSDILDKKTEGYLRVICTINSISKGGHVAALSKGTLEYAKGIKSIKISPGIERDLIGLLRGDDASGSVAAGVVRVDDMIESTCPHLLEVSLEVLKNRQNPGKLDKGEGQYIYDNGARYTGTFAGKLRHGTGCMEWPDGAKFKGTWVKDLPSGKGLFLHPNGDTYEGHLQNGVPHGTGIYKHANGTTYQGEWKEGMKHGKGREKWSDSCIYEGTFKEGVKHGEGTFNWGNGHIYKGSIIKNKLEGNGRMVWPDGRAYKGTWKNNNIHGTGIFRFADKKVYEGEYRNNVRQGSGKMSDPVAKIRYCGGWENGKQHGVGYVVRSNNFKDEGLWDKGFRLK